MIVLSGTVPFVLPTAASTSCTPPASQPPRNPAAGAVNCIYSSATCPASTGPIIYMECPPFDHAVVPHAAYPEGTVENAGLPSVLRFTLSVPEYPLPINQMKMPPVVVSPEVEKPPVPSAGSPGALDPPPDVILRTQNFSLIVSIAE